MSHLLVRPGGDSYESNCCLRNGLGFFDYFLSRSGLVFAYRQQLSGTQLIRDDFAAMSDTGFFTD